MNCICRDHLFAGHCPEQCLIRWATVHSHDEQSPALEGLSPRLRAERETAERIQVSD